MSRIAFVTVGTTSFDGLIKALDTPAFVTWLASEKYTALVMQLGRGTHNPQSLPAECERHGVRFEQYDYKPSLALDMEAASLVISHAGAGTLLESLRADKRVCVVINDTLMDNHQVELAEALSANGHCAFASPATVLQVLRETNFAALLPFEKAKPQRFADFLDGAMGFS